MRTKLKIALEVLTPHPMRTVEEAKALLCLWCKLIPELAPERYGDSEPLRKRFDPRNLDEVAKGWTFGFFAKRSKPKVEASVWPRHPRRENGHAVVELSVESGSAVEQSIITFFLETAKVFDADLGYITALTNQEIQQGLKCDTVFNLNRPATKFNFFVPSHIIKRHVPDVCWATLFGPAYVKFFGLERLMSSPAPVVEQLRDDMVLIQLSKTIEEMDANCAEVERVRQAVKQHLNNNAFFDPAAPADHVYNVPTFIWKDPGPASAQTVPNREVTISILPSKGSTRSRWKKEIMGSDPETEALMQRGAREALEVAKDNGFELDYSEASMDVVECLLDQLARDFKETGNAEGVAGLAMILGAYIGVVFRGRGSGGTWERRTEASGIDVFQFQWRGLSLPLAAWCAKRIFIGEAENVSLKYHAVVASRSGPEPSVR